MRFSPYIGSYVCLIDAAKAWNKHLLRVFPEQYDERANDIESLSCDCINHKDRGHDAHRSTWAPFQRTNKRRRGCFRARRRAQRSKEVLSCVCNRETIAAESLGRIVGTKPRPSHLQPREWSASTWTATAASLWASDIACNFVTVEWLWIMVCVWKCFCKCRRTWTWGFLALFVLSGRLPVEANRRQLLSETSLLRFRLRNFELFQTLARWALSVPFVECASD